MHFGSDESGDFNMARQWNESCSVWATVACPDRHVERVRAWVRDRCQEWGVEEIHSRRTRKTRSLTPEERHAVCAFVGTGDLLWEATVVDSLMLSASEIAARQANQLEQFRADWARSDRHRSADPAEVELGQVIEELLDPAGGVRSSPFTQYGVVAPTHVRETVQAVVRVYQDDQWRDEFRSLRMAFDRKNEPERPHDTPGEILFFSVVMPILASPKMSLALPLPFQDPSHPLRACHPGRSTDGICISSLLDGGVSFIDSTHDELVQLADVLAYVMRRALTKPDDDAAQRSYSVARRRLYMRTPVMFSGESFSAFERYHHILR